MIIINAENSADPADPAFVLSRPQRTVTASAGDRVFHSAAEAAAQLRSRRVTHIVGALPFTPGAPAALWAPETVAITDGPRAARAVHAPEIAITESLPEPEEHVRRVGSALRLLADPANPLRKVVLARKVRARADRAVRALDLLDLLVSTDHAGNGYLVDLSAAGGVYTGRHLVGSSPEILVRRLGSEVTSHPLAGSARRIADDPVADRIAAVTLLGSAKDQHEHGYVVRHVADVLRDRCTDVRTPTTPDLTETPAMWHLGTTIGATVPAGGPTALELADALHPTPAICGTPTAAAARLIAELEGERGFYAGAVGWCDADGNGEWMVSIRCAELAADHRTLLAYAGGGIVAESDPDDELAETTGKLQRVLGPLGVTGRPATVP
ncbi:isochorismate synthase [Nocardia carnea]|uniref:isochorismate synthase n=1 Tax=Nocardia carnea TaxID=37328 RepID=UPI00245882BE|nr:chorismate-binding protein [Nocardia carnea]